VAVSSWFEPSRASPRRQTPSSPAVAVSGRSGVSAADGVSESRVDPAAEGVEADPFGGSVRLLVAPVGD